MGGVVHHRRAPDLRVRDHDLHVVGRRQLGGEQADLLHRAGVAGDLDVLAHLERAEDQQHHPGGDVGERALQGQADGQAGGAEDGDQARGLDAELVQHGDQHEGQDHVLDQAGEEAAQRVVDPLDLAQRPAHAAGDPVRGDPADEQDGDAAHHRHAVGGGERHHQVDGLLRALFKLIHVRPLPCVRRRHARLNVD